MEINQKRLNLLQITSKMVNTFKLYLERLEQVRRSPDSVAVSFEKQFLTYEQLNKKSNRLANYLKVLGIGPEVVVGICLERSVETIVSILAVLKAGGAYLPIDPVYPSERISFMVEDAHIPVLITHSGLKENLKQIIATSVESIRYIDGIEANTRYEPTASGGIFFVKSLK